VFCLYVHFLKICSCLLNSRSTEILNGGCEIEILFKIEIGITSATSVLIIFFQSVSKNECNLEVTNHYITLGVFTVLSLYFIWYAAFDRCAVLLFSLL